MVRRCVQAKPLRLCIPRLVIGVWPVWPERGDDSRTRHVNDLLIAYARSTTQTSSPLGAVLTLQPPPAFCSDPAISKSLAYRWDGTHYYKPGSALSFQSAIPQLLAPLS